MRYMYVRKYLISFTTNAGGCRYHVLWPMMSKTHRDENVLYIDVGEDISIYVSNQFLYSPFLSQVEFNKLLIQVKRVRLASIGASDCLQNF